MQRLAGKEEASDSAEIHAYPILFTYRGYLSGTSNRLLSGKVGKIVAQNDHRIKFVTHKVIGAKTNLMTHVLFECGVFRVASHVPREDVQM